MPGSIVSRAAYGRFLAFTIISAALIGAWFGADLFSKMMVFVLSVSAILGLAIGWKIIQAAVSRVFRS